MADGPPAADDVLVLVGSNRTGSYNRQLAELVVAGLADRDLPARLVPLGDLELPLFDADLEQRDGPPPAAHELQAELAAAAGVVIVSPEYNGAMTPLLKNTVDWVSRVDVATFFTKRVALAAATPGRRGGAASLDLTARWLGYIGAEVHPEPFGLPSVRHALVDGVLVDEHAPRLASWIDAVADIFGAPSGPDGQSGS